MHGAAFQHLLEVATNATPGGVGRRGGCALERDSERGLPVAIVVVFPMAMAITVTTVMVVANAETNRANMYADNCCVGRCGQKSKREDGRDKRFHGGQLSVGGPLRVTQRAVAVR
jgi:hypothetical protein